MTNNHTKNKPLPPLYLFSLKRRSLTWQIMKLIQFYLMFRLLTFLSTFLTLACWDWDKSSKRFSKTFWNSSLFPEFTIIILRSECWATSLGRQVSRCSNKNGKMFFSYSLFTEPTFAKTETPLSTVITDLYQSRKISLIHYLLHL